MKDNTIEEKLVIAIYANKPDYEGLWDAIDSNRTEYFSKSLNLFWFKGYWKVEWKAATIKERLFFGLFMKLLINSIRGQEANNGSIL